MDQNPEKVTCLSIIICDDIYRDEKTKKLVIVGSFSTINCPAFPALHPRFKILFTLTNGKGKYNLSLAIEHAESGNELMEMKGKLSLEDPLAISDLDVEIQGMTLPAAGKYWVTIKADGELVGQRPFVAHLTDQGEEKK